MFPYHVYSTGPTNLVCKKYNTMDELHGIRDGLASSLGTMARLVAIIAVTLLLQLVVILIATLSGHCLRPNTYLCPLADLDTHQYPPHTYAAPSAYHTWARLGHLIPRVSALYKASNWRRATAARCDMGHSWAATAWTAGGYYLHQQLFALNTNTANVRL